jgi:hypothetical protein
MLTQDVNTVEQTNSTFAVNKQYAAINAAYTTRINSKKLNAMQLQAINALYNLVSSVYDCFVYKNVRKHCATVKVQYAKCIANNALYNELMQYCTQNNITVQYNTNTNSVSYVITF